MLPKVVVIGLSGESVFLKTNHFHRPGETIHANSLITEPGGKGYNQAVALKKFGTDVTYLTTVGNDINGNNLINYLINLGIDVKYRVVNENSAYAVIITDKVGNNQVTVYEGASKLLNKEDVSLIEEDIKSAQYLLVQLEIPFDVLIETMKIARENNVKIVLNPAPSKLVINDEICQMADILTPNEIEVRDLFNLPAELKIEEYGLFLSEKTNQELVITLGKKGALHVKNGYYKYYQPLEVVAIDTTGAGDIFNAGLVSNLVSGKTMDQSIKFAVVAAGMSVTKENVMNAIPTLEEVIKKIENN